MFVNWEDFSQFYLQETQNSTTSDSISEPFYSAASLPSVVVSAVPQLLPTSMISCFTHIPLQSTIVTGSENGQLIFWEDSCNGVQTRHLNHTDLSFPFKGIQIQNSLSASQKPSDELLDKQLKAIQKPAFSLPKSTSPQTLRTIIALSPRKSSEPSDNERIRQRDSNGGDSPSANDEEVYQAVRTHIEGMLSQKETWIEEERQKKIRKTPLMEITKIIPPSGSPTKSFATLIKQYDSLHSRHPRRPVTSEDRINGGPPDETVVRMPQQKTLSTPSAHDMFVSKLEQRQARWKPSTPHTMYVTEKSPTVGIKTVCWLEKSGVLAVASADARITFYDGLRWQPVGHVCGLSATVFHMCCVEVEKKGVGSRVGEDEVKTGNRLVVDGSTERELLVTGMENGEIVVFVVSRWFCRKKTDLTLIRGTNELKGLLGEEMGVRADLKEEEGERSIFARETEEDLLIKRYQQETSRSLDTARSQGDQSARLPMGSPALSAQNRPMTQNFATTPPPIIRSAQPQQIQSSFKPSLSRRPSSQQQMTRRKVDWNQPETILLSVPRSQRFRSENDGVDGTMNRLRKEDKLQRNMKWKKSITTNNTPFSSPIISPRTLSRNTARHTGFQPISYNDQSRYSPLSPGADNSQDTTTVFLTESPSTNLINIDDFDSQRVSSRPNSGKRPMTSVDTTRNRNKMRFSSSGTIRREDQDNIPPSLRHVNLTLQDGPTPPSPSDILQTLKLCSDPPPPEPTPPSRPIRRDYEGSWSCQAHTDTITSMRFVEELGLIATGSLDATVRLFDPLSLTQHSLMNYHSQGVTTLAFSAVKRLFLTGSEDKTVCVVDSATMELVERLKGHTTILESVAFDEQRDRIITLDVGGLQQFRMIDRLTNTPFTSFNWVHHNHHSTLFLLSTRLISCDSNVGRKTQVTNDSVGAVISVHFSSPFHQLITVDTHSICTVWFADTGKRHSTFLCKHDEGDVVSACLDDDGRRLMTVSLSGNIKTWNFNTGQQLDEIDTPQRVPSKKHVFQFEVEEDVVNEVARQSEKRKEANPFVVPTNRPTSSIELSSVRRMRKAKDEKRKAMGISVQREPPKQSSASLHPSHILSFSNVLAGNTVGLLAEPGVAMLLFEKGGAQSGGERVLHVPNDLKKDQTEEVPTISNPLAAVFIPPNNLAVSWDNGRICVWNTETGVEKMTLRRQGEEKKDKKNDLDQTNDNPKSVPVLQSSTRQTSFSRPLTNQPTTPVLPTLTRSRTTLGVCSACLISDPSRQDILIAHTSDGLITIFSLSTRQKVVSFECYEAVAVGKVSADGRLLVLGGSDGVVTTFNLEKILSLAGWHDTNRNEFGFSESAVQLKTSHPVHLQPNQNQPLHRWRWMDSEIAGLILLSHRQGDGTRVDLVAVACGERVGLLTVEGGLIGEFGEDDQSEIAVGSREKERDVMLRRREEKPRIGRVLGELFIHTTEQMLPIPFEWTIESTQNKKRRRHQPKGVAGLDGPQLVSRQSSSGLRSRLGAEETRKNLLEESSIPPIPETSSPVESSNVKQPLFLVSGLNSLSSSYSSFSTVDGDDQSTQKPPNRLHTERRRVGVRAKRIGLMHPSQTHNYTRQSSLSVLGGSSGRAIERLIRREKMNVESRREKGEEALRMLSRREAHERASSARGKGGDSSRESDDLKPLASEQLAVLQSAWSGSQKNHRGMLISEGEGEMFGL
ncbi:hypothetical protein BLNAU_2236 [Blattamonas nauphoetae]|uniref:Uncharacterized protein n=1 Tax=Blattamonas nauphoetae TaxID=2049346 RepID=A0ABQ9YGC3_9EUKA|nr:hypothetical protein BLNAU_2236 [Blattamonas nauphoetae]